MIFRRVCIFRQEILGPVKVLQGNVELYVLAGNLTN